MEYTAFKGIEKRIKIIKQIRKELPIEAPSNTIFINTKKKAPYALPTAQLTDDKVDRLSGGINIKSRQLHNRRKAH